jgi:hypothetical protein
MFLQKLAFCKFGPGTDVFISKIFSQKLATEITKVHY